MLPESTYQHRNQDIRGVARKNFGGLWIFGVRIEFGSLLPYFPSL